MTPAELRRITETQVTVPFTVALHAFGISEATGRRSLKRGDLPFDVIRLGKVLRVRTADLRQLLAPAGPLAPDPPGPDSRTGRPGRRPASTDSTPSKMFESLTRCATTVADVKHNALGAAS